MTLSHKSKTVKRALLVIDVQNEYFTGQLPVYYPSGSLDNILVAIDVAISREIPVIVIQHTQLDENTEIFCKDSPQWQLHPKIADKPYTLLIEKNFPGSFTGTDLEAWLRKHDIDTVVISGYMTQVCCDTTARQASHLGLSVEFLSDATGTLDFETKVASASAEEIHRSTLVVQQSFISQVMTTSEWIQEVEKDLKSDSKIAAV
ncbi:cysteine hydrolase family protein [Mastigocoleus testarum]|uniref:Isochorismatase n=1 Tax=Mastigocoleus testarum BC008 TaxID=371196 RepID=A0A0V7ZWR2_9CYAN|nr:cysteine hydrolase family protein [Mastigocoleus testarum]KST68970.1 isochorismatase [Mastigocoleus testarum BC008]